MRQILSTVKTDEAIHETVRTLAHSRIGLVLLQEGSLLHTNLGLVDPPIRLFGHTSIHIAKSSL